MTTRDDVNPHRSFNPTLLLILLPLVLGMLLSLPAVGFENVARYFGGVLGTALLEFALLAPLVLLALWRSSSKHRRLLGLAAALYILSLASIMLPKAPFVRALDLDWNWQGKLLDISWTLLFVFLWRGGTLRQVGLRWRLQPGSLRPVLVVLAMLAVLFTILGFSVGTPNPEEVAFMWLMPGLAEELVFRGVLLMLLNDVFGRPWRLAGASVGWGFVITSVLFGFLHGALVTGNGLSLQPSNIIITGLFGALLCWLRERSGSLWPAMLAHSLIDGAVFIVPLVRLL